VLGAPLDNNSIEPSVQKVQKLLLVKSKGNDPLKGLVPNYGYSVDVRDIAMLHANGRAVG
jgi:hypothetical protein